ncbi:hypothetical protein NNRS527_03231 (plasmid) [Nitrosospira sp. NRS527]|nr:hypothetical protein NNRS527_03231 [Nitrosospira sp. NRS527]
MLVDWLLNRKLILKWQCEAVALTFVTFSATIASSAAVAPFRTIPSQSAEKAIVLSRVASWDHNMG